jgi:hypothetical protein
MFLRNVILLPKSCSCRLSLSFLVWLTLRHGAIRILLGNAGLLELHFIATQKNHPFIVAAMGTTDPVFKYVCNFSQTYFSLFFSNSLLLSNGFNMFQKEAFRDFPTHVL